MEPTILYEDADILVINKPSGLMIHADGKHDYPTLVEWLLSKYPDIKGVGEEQKLITGEVIDRPGIVHRIDRETSGVLVVARTHRAYEYLKRQFKDREVRKTYRAFVHGIIKDERGIIDKPIGSTRGGTGPRSARSPHGETREAITAYRVITRTPTATYIEAFPKTGRTHQIRVHLSAIQHPIISDRLYAPRRPQMLGFTRLALHAFSLSFKHPDGRELTFEAPLPQDFLAAENELRVM